MFHYKKGMAYKTTADSTSFYADALVNTLLNDVLCYFVHHLPNFQNMHPYRIAADADIDKHVATTSCASWLSAYPRDLPFIHLLKECPG